MKTKYHVISIARILLLSYCAGIVLYGCTSDDAQTEEAVASEEGENVDESPAEENADAQASSDHEEPGSEDTAANAVIAEAEAIVEESPEEEVSTEDASTETFAAPTTPSTTEPESVPLAADTPSQSAEYVKNDAAKTNVVPSAPVESELMTEKVETTTGRVVRYARKSLTIHQAANQTSASAGTLRQGDIVMVTYEGDWARLDNGAYVTARGLSAKGVGRSKPANTWASRK